MPAFITHLLISRDSDFDALSIKAIAEKKNYFSLGSLGPDLPYYRNVFGSAIGTFFEERFNSKSSGFYLGHGDYFHSRTPNIFPMKLLEVILKDNKQKGDDNNLSKLAFAYGYLTHMAADFIFHPYVNSIAGSYYLMVDNARKHRNVEVCLDRFILENQFQKKMFEEDFASWIDIAPPPEKKPEMTADITADGHQSTYKEYSQGWFWSFIQRAFLESYSVLIEGKEIEEWVSGFNSVLDSYSSIGPYRDLMDKKGSELANLYKEYSANFKKEKVPVLYQSVIELAKKFIQAAEEFIKTSRITNAERNKFLDIVPDDDLTAPLMR
jgi:hypothetical protein